MILHDARIFRRYLVPATDSSIAACRRHHQVELEHADSDFSHLEKLCTALTDIARLEFKGMATSRRMDNDCHPTTSGNSHFL